MCVAMGFVKLEKIVSIVVRIVEKNDNEVGQSNVVMEVVMEIRPCRWTLHDPVVLIFVVVVVKMDLPAMQVLPVLVVVMNQ